MGCVADGEMDKEWLLCGHPNRTQRGQEGLGHLAGSFGGVTPKPTAPLTPVPVLIPPPGVNYQQLVCN